MLLALFDLNGFQLLFGSLMALLAVTSLVAVARRAVSRREGFLWAALSLGGCLAVLWPEMTSVVASWLGIGRGADLVSYLAVGAMLVGFFMTYVRLRALRREMTLLVRRIALLELPPPAGVAEDRQEP